MQVTIPELEQINKRLENIESLLLKQQAPVELKTESSNHSMWMMGPEVRHMFHCGTDRVKKMVEEGKLEISNDFGRYPRYRLVH
jgi:hypothetical protein